MKEQQAADGFQDSNLPALCGFTNEVTPAYGIFH